MLKYKAEIKGDIFMIKNYIFDFGNVLARFNPDELTEIYVKDEAYRKTVSEIVFDRLYWDRLDDGSITDDEVKQAFCKRLPKELHESACLVYDGWVGLKTPINGMQKLVADIKAQGGKLYLLSNISIGFAENYHKNSWVNELFSLFDGLVFSGPIGIVKPDRKIFEHLLKLYNLKAEECIFIDDSLKNVVGAENVGIKGYLFDGDADKLRKELNIPEI
jgi:putative hydrolase of the HAD superfamily